MTLKELLELGVKEGIIVEEKPDLIEGFKADAVPDNTVLRNFTAKIEFCFSEDELANTSMTELEAEKFLMSRMSEAGGSVGCIIVWGSEGAIKLTNP
jgi:hypothetical protein